MAVSGPLSGQWRRITLGLGWRSQFFALVRDGQFELPAFEAHQHAAELVPVDLASVDDQKREAAVVGIVPLDPAAHDPMIGDLQPVLAIDNMLHGQGAVHLLNQAPQQRQQIVRRLADDLERVTGRISVPKLEGVERNPGPEQMRAEMELQ